MPCSDTRLTPPALTRTYCGQPGDGAPGTGQCAQTRFCAQGCAEADVCPYRGGPRALPPASCTAPPALDHLAGQIPPCHVQMCGHIQSPRRARPGRRQHEAGFPCSPVGVSWTKLVFKQSNVCNSLFLHSLEFEDVHSLRVAGGGEEHAVHAEGQRADAHTPAGRSRVGCHSGHRAASNLPKGQYPSPRGGQFPDPASAGASPFLQAPSHTF